MPSSESEGASSQALKLQATSIPTNAQGLKLQARSLKLQDLMTRVQAISPKLRVTSYKHIGILFMFSVEGYLMWGYLDFSGLCSLQFQCKKVPQRRVAQYIRSAK